MRYSKISVYSPHVSETVSLVHAPCFWEGIRPDQHLPMFWKSIRPCMNTCPCFWGCIRPWTNTCPMFLRGYLSRPILAHVLKEYSSVYEYLPLFLRMYSSVDEYLPHVFERVFVRRRMLVPCLWEGIRPWTNTYPMCWRECSSMDEYLPRVLKRVFVRRTDEYSPHGFERVFVRRRIGGYSSRDKPNTKLLFVFVFVRGVQFCRTRSKMQPQNKNHPPLHSKHVPVLYIVQFCT